MQHCVTPRILSPQTAWNLNAATVWRRLPPPCDVGFPDTFPIVQSLRDKELDKKEKKNKGCPQTKNPWCKDQWSEFKKANPDVEFKEISTILGTKWKTIRAEEKQPYEEKCQAEKEAYLKVVGNEKRENEAMKLLEEEQKQRTGMELLQQYLQFKREAKRENKKTKLLRSQARNGRT